jgi:hypothetical protein
VESTSDLVARLVFLGDEVDAMSERLKKKVDEWKNLNNLVAERLQLEKTQSIGLEDGRKVFLRSQYWAKKKHEGVDGKAVHDALIAAGLPELATESYNSNTLSAWMRERFKENPNFTVPEPLAELVTFSKVTQVSVTGT